MIRNEIENVTFKMKFLLSINKLYKERLTDYYYYEKNPYSFEFDKKYLWDLTKYLAWQNSNHTLRSSKVQDKEIIELDVSHLITPTEEELFSYYPGRLFLRETLLATKAGV